MLVFSLVACVIIAVALGRGTSSATLHAALLTGLSVSIAAVVTSSAFFIRRAWIRQMNTLAPVVIATATVVNWGVSAWQLSDVAENKQLVRLGVV